MRRLFGSSPIGGLSRRFGYPGYREYYSVTHAVKDNNPEVTRQPGRYLGVCGARIDEPTIVEMDENEIGPADLCRNCERVLRRKTSR